MQNGQRLSNLEGEGSTIRCQPPLSLAHRSKFSYSAFSHICLISMFRFYVVRHDSISSTLLISSLQPLPSRNCLPLVCHDLGAFQFDGNGVSQNTGRNSRFLRYRYANSKWKKTTPVSFNPLSAWTLGITIGMVQLRPC